MLAKVLRDILSASLYRPTSRRSRIIVIPHVTTSWTTHLRHTDHVHRFNRPFWTLAHHRRSPESRVIIHATPNLIQILYSALFDIITDFHVFSTCLPPRCSRRRGVSQ